MLHMTETLSLDGLIAALEKLVETGLAQLHELEASGRITMGGIRSTRDAMSNRVVVRNLRRRHGIRRRGRRAGPYLRA